MRWIGEQFKCADEDSLGMIRRSRYRVDAIIHSVNKIDVSVAFFTVHGFIARGAFAATGVCPQIVRAAVCFCFDYSRDDSLSVIVSD